MIGHKNKLSPDYKITIAIHKRCFLLVAIFLLSLVGAGATPFISGIFTGPASALNETQRGLISQNCGSIRQSLKQLQVSDSRTRVYLGSIYETILSDYMAPLVTSINNNNLISNTTSAIITQQSDFSVSRSNFSSTYIEYQRTLESLVNYDCMSDPDGFYEKLESAREQRADLEAIVAQMRTKLDTHISTIKTLINELENESEAGND